MAWLNFEFHSIVYGDVCVHLRRDVLLGLVLPCSYSSHTGTGYFHPFWSSYLRTPVSHLSCNHSGDSQVDVGVRSPGGSLGQHRCSPGPGCHMEKIPQTRN